MREDLVDPRHLPRSWSPGVIFTDNGERLFVADATITKTGWVSARRWDQSRLKFPPHVVYKIERVETERTRRGNTTMHGLVDDDALEQARRLAEDTEETAEEAIADD